MSWIRNIFYLGYWVIAVAILLEIVFRVLPTSDSLRVKPVNSRNPYLRYEENRTVTKQIGFDFTHVNVKRINNYGFASKRDFNTNERVRKKVVAVIGDSYVEALQVSDEDSFHAKIDAIFNNIDVYPTAVSGSALSQYIAYKNYTKNNFSPDLYVFLIIENDFIQSSYEGQKNTGFHYFNDIGALVRDNYLPSKIKKIARHSAFLRYLNLDLKLTIQLGKLFQFQTNANNEKLKNDEINEARGKKAVDWFLAEIRDLAAEKPVIFILDGDRSSIYAGKKGRDFNIMANRHYQYLFEKSQSIPNLSTIDLHPVFQNDWGQSKKEFNYKYDYHWNERGHAVAADALIKFIGEIEK
tara:strand:- start:493 stop:1551 length:1059 start_codon:yes stop_codon:yes gene_type:complete